MQKNVKKSKGVLAFISESPEFLKQTEDLKNAADISKLDVQTSEQASKQTGKQENRQSRKQANIHANEQTQKQTGKQGEEQADKHSNAQANMQVAEQTNNQVNNHADKQADTHANTQALTFPVNPKLGLTENQIIFLNKIKDIPYIEGTYEDIRGAFGFNTADSVRGIIYRLTKRGFLHKQRIKRGNWTGVNIRINAEYKHMIESDKYMQTNEHTPMHLGMQTGVQASMGTSRQADPSKIDRKENISLSKEKKSEKRLLKLSNEDISFYWPKLRETGFGEHQIQQIVKRLSKVEKSTDYVLMSLDYIEFELEQGSLKDKHGQEVSSPCAYIFNALAKNGYYRKPANYLSPLEQAAKDMEMQLKTEKEAKLKIKNIEFEKTFEKWKKNLTESELEKLRQKQPGKKDLNNNYLKSCFKTHLSSAP